MSSYALLLLSTSVDLTNTNQNHHITAHIKFNPSQPSSHRLSSHSCNCTRFYHSSTTQRTWHPPAFLLFKCSPNRPALTHPASANNFTTCLCRFTDYTLFQSVCLNTGSRDTPDHQLRSTIDSRHGSRSGVQSRFQCGWQGIFRCDRCRLSSAVFNASRFQLAAITARTSLLWARPPLPAQSRPPRPHLHLPTTALPVRICSNLHHLLCPRLPSDLRRALPPTALPPVPATAM